MSTKSTAASAGMRMARAKQPSQRAYTSSRFKRVFTTGGGEAKSPRPRDMAAHAKVTCAPAAVYHSGGYIAVRAAVKKVDTTRVPSSIEYQLNRTGNILGSRAS